MNRGTWDVSTVNTLPSLPTRINSVRADAGCDGRPLGASLPHGKGIFRAIDCDGRLVGVFASQREAAAAIMRDVR